jgi:hypothetical protein
MQSPTYLHDLLVSTLFTEGLDAEMSLWALGFSAMWIEGADLKALAQPFHLDLGTRTPCYLSEILDHAIDDVSHWIGIVPAHGHGEFLRSVTEGGRQALGLLMDINYNASFAYARDRDCTGHLRCNS